METNNKQNIRFRINLLAEQNLRLKKIYIQMENKMRRIRRMQVDIYEETARLHCTKDENGNYLMVTDK